MSNFYAVNGKYLERLVNGTWMVIGSWCKPEDEEHESLTPDDKERERELVPA